MSISSAVCIVTLNDYVTNNNIWTIWHLQTALILVSSVHLTTSNTMQETAFVILLLQQQLLLLATILFITSKFLTLVKFIVCCNTFNLMQPHERSMLHKLNSYALCRCTSAVNSGNCLNRDIVPFHFDYCCTSVRHLLGAIGQTCASRHSKKLCINIENIPR